MECEELLSKLRDMFDHRPNKLILRRAFEGRIWKVDETFSDYHHDKVIMANKVPIDKEEFIDYLIDGIHDGRLHDQARMQQFRTVSSLLEVFKSITLRSDVRRNIGISAKASTQSDLSSKMVMTLKSSRCYNCGAKGHLSASCTHPRREKGSCFTCGSMDHQYQSCPQKQSSTLYSINRQGITSGETTAALIDRPEEAEADGNKLYCQSRYR